MFLTLTYDDFNLPEGGTLLKRDHQTFLKRLRQYCWRQHKIKIRYFLVGEYGDKTQRPHYHALIFGLWFHDQKKYKKNDQGDFLYRSPTLDRLWGKGLATFGQLTYESAAYCARYTLKKQGGKFAAGHYERLDLATGEVIQVQPEYAQMSTHPGIGRDFYEKYAGDIHRGDFCIVKGHKQKPPRYYDKVLFSRLPDRHDQLKQERKKLAEKQSEHNTTARLRVREEVKKSQIKQLKRSL